MAIPRGRHYWDPSQYKQDSIVLEFTEEEFLELAEALEDRLGRNDLQRAAALMKVSERVKYMGDMYFMQKRARKKIGLD